MAGNALHIDKNMRQVFIDCGFQSEDASKPGYIAFGVNWGYTGAQSSSNLNAESIAAIVALLVLIVFTGYLVIYNVFQISVTIDIRFYGLLKTIGMTGRQLKIMLVWEGLFYALGSILIALVLALVLGPLSAPTLENLFWFFTYRFTLAPILPIFPIFVVLGLVIPLLTYRSIARHTVVERLREAE